MNNFHYFNPVQIHFGQGKLDLLPQLIGERRVLFITSQGFRKRGVLDIVLNQIDHIVQVIDTVPPNPTLADLKTLYAQIEMNEFDVIVALGGGSVIDAAKVLSVKPEHKSFQEVESLIKNGAGLKYELCPIIAIPTTSGTSSEITPWATVWDPDGGRKYSLHLKDLWCESAVYDPCLTVSLPKELTLQTGLDALSHAMESLWNKNANPISRKHAASAIQLILDTLPVLAKDLSNLELRESLMFASMKSGLAFSNTQTAIAHAISYELTLSKGIPHGIACSFTLPYILDVVLKHPQQLQDAYLKELQKVQDQDLKSWMESLGITTNFNDYHIETSDLNRIKAGLDAVPRSKNSLVNLDRLFESFAMSLEA